MKKILESTEFGLDFNSLKKQEKEPKKTLALSINTDTHELIKLKFFNFHFEKKLPGKQATETFLLTNLLLNIEKLFTQKYGEILIPDEEYLTIYKRKRGRSRDGEKSETYAVIMQSKYIDLLYRLIHTRYVNELENKNLRRYVPGEFFNDVIYDFLKNNKLELIQDGE